MQDLYDARSRDIAAYADAFSAQADQVGAIFAIDGRVVAVEMFDSPGTFARYFRKLLSSYALDALDVAEPRPARPGGSHAVDTTVTWWPLRRSRSA